MTRHRDKRKKANLGPDRAIESPPKQDYISRIPLELLAEILSSSSTKEVLAVSRCSRYFCNTLVLNPDSNFIWRRARKLCLPKPLPDPTPNFTEPAYAALIFDSGACEICGQNVKQPLRSFSLRLRLCNTPACHHQWSKDHAIFRGEMAFNSELAQSIIQMGVHSSEGSFELPVRTEYEYGWHHNESIFFRRTECLEALDEQTRLVAASSTDALTLDNIYILRRRRRDKTMSLAAELLKWWVKRIHLYAEVKSFNLNRAREIAEREGWKYEDLLNSTAYQAMHQNKKIIMERITDQDFSAIRDRVEEELANMLMRRQQSNRENSLQKRREDVAMQYHIMKSAKEPAVMPTLPIFRAQPIIQVFQKLQSNNDVSVFQGFSQMPVMKTILRDNLDTWSEKAMKDFATILGHSKYRTISDKKLHPVYRLTARFACSKCQRMNKRWSEDGCMDFKSACSHRCVGLNKKQKAKEVWKAEQFLADEKAIKAIRDVLKLIGVKEEDPLSLEVVKTTGSCILCNSCPAPILMDFSSVIGHQKRHDDMKISLLSPDEANAILKYPIQRGLCAQLFGPEKSATRKQAMIIYGCRHCQQRHTLDTQLNKPTHDAQITKGDETQSNGHLSDKPVNKKKETKRLEKLMSFHGLRSHLKSSHSIEHVRDEDIYSRPDEVPKSL